MKIEHITYDACHQAGATRPSQGMKIEHITYDACHKSQTNRPSTTAEKLKSFFRKSDYKDEHATKKAQFNPAILHSTIPPPTSPDSSRVAREEARTKLEQQRRAFEKYPKDAGRNRTHDSTNEYKTSHSPSASNSVVASSPSTPGTTMGFFIDRGRATKLKTHDTRRSGEEEKKRAADMTHVPLFEWKSSKKNMLQCKSKYSQSTTPSAAPLPRRRDQERLHHAPNTRLQLQSSSHPPSTVASKPTSDHSRIEKRTCILGFEPIELKRRDVRPSKESEKPHAPALLNFKQRKAPEIGDDSDSDESFCCVGEQASAPSRDARPARINSKSACRLCHIRKSAGIRGICVQCEDTYCSPLPEVFEIKPTPPLKVHTKVGSGSSTMLNTPSPDSPPPPVPLKDNELAGLNLHKVVAKPTVVHAPPARRSSHRAVFGNVEPARPFSSRSTIKRQPSQRSAPRRIEPVRRRTITKSARWQPGSVKNAYLQRPQTTLRQESNASASSYYTSAVSSSSGCTTPGNGNGGGTANLLTEQSKISRKPKALKQSHSFYEPLLREYGIQTPTSEASARRYDGL